MALTSILLHVGDEKASEDRLRVASSLAREFGARLTALYAMPPVDMSVMYGLERVPELVESYRQGIRDRAKQVEAAFWSRVEQDGLTGEWRCEEGDAISLVTLHARYADLAVVGQRSPDELAMSPNTNVPEHVVLGAGRPTLVVPYIGGRATIGQRILVAWNGSREAARAVNDALPLLERAGRVVVLAVDPKKAAGRIPGADIAAHLARHGVRAEATQTPSGGIGIGDALLSRAADIDCDLIVMGAYGHSRVREFVLGGATRHILDHMTVPVLMAH